MTYKTYPYHENIPVAKLRLDGNNPRLPDVQNTQIEALHTMARVQGDKLVVLAQHVIDHGGLSVSERFIVIPDGHEQYMVLDGNRRLTVLKALNNPDIIMDFLTSQAAKQLRDLAKAFEQSPILEVSCTVYKDRDHADPWIELMHDGESGGAGLVKWSAQQRIRYQSRKGTKALYLQVLDHVVEHGQLSEETREKLKVGRYPTSTLKRLLGTPYVRTKLGIDSPEALTDTPGQDVIRDLSKVVDEIGSGDVKVTRLMTLAQRENYIDNLNEPEPTRWSNKTTSNRSGTAKPKTLRERQHSSQRNYLIQKNTKLNITVDRINDVYHELKNRLVVTQTPNAVAVLIRVFLEMSLDEYIDLNKIPLTRGELKFKIEAVANYMEQNQILNRNALKPIRRMASNETDPHSTTTLNGYVHNRHFTPSPSDLIATWNTLFIFIQKLWQ